MQKCGIVGSSQFVGLSQCGSPTAWQLRKTSLPRHHLHPDFRAEVPNEDEVREGEVGVVEKVVKRADEVQVFGEFRVEQIGRASCRERV